MESIHLIYNQQCRKAHVRVFLLLLVLKVYHLG